ncbi:MAG: lipoate--protein ligase family protein [candidate division Zixibacteria bacterium]|nr:lipoate--protein ligase family protein [candidate division Zixibacteria bacterium]
MDLRPAIRRWTILPPLEADVLTQMAFDAVILDQCEQAEDDGYLRFYRMTPAALTIGYHQKWQRVIDPEACRKRGWEWARRPTGGGALLHANEINYAVAMSTSGWSRQGNVGVQSVFQLIADAIVSGLTRLGFGADMHVGMGRVAGSERFSQHGLCGRSVTGHEISLKDAKLVASAQLLRPKGVLQHGTIYLTAPSANDRFWPADPTEPETGRLKMNWADLGANRSSMCWQEVAGMLELGFRQRWGIDTESCTPTTSLRSTVRSQEESWQRVDWNRRL